MKNKKIISITILVLLLLTSAVNYAQNIAQDDISNFINNTMSYHLENENIVGAVVTVVKNDEIIFNKGYGYADIESTIDSDGQTVAYEIGSISKTFVALSALQLVEEGKLDLHEPISTYLKDDDFNFKYPITMHDLLTHSAGFEDQLAGLGINALEDYQGLRYHLVNFKPSQVFPPGEVTSYSNYGIGLAAYVIESIVNQPYHTVVEDNILKPLAMDHTTFKLGEVKAKYLAKGHTNDGTVGTEQYVSLYPAGAATATGEDMGKYLKFLLNDNDQLLRKNLKSQLFKKQFTMIQSLAGVGYTWNRDVYNNENYYRKKGERQLTKSKILIYPSEQMGVFIAINNSISNELFEQLSQNITHYILGKQELTVVDQKNSHDISGSYVSTKSSFSKEKFLNVLIPNKIISIDLIDDHFYINDEALKMLENNTFMYNDKILKYIEKNGTHYLVANGAESYIQLPWYEGKGWQIFSILFYFMMSLIMLIISLKNIILNNGLRKDGLIYSNLKYVPGVIMFLLNGLMIISVFLLIHSTVDCLISILLFLSNLILINGTLFLLLIKKINYNASKITKSLNGLFILSTLNMLFWLYNMHLIL